MSLLALNFIKNSKLSPRSIRERIFYNGRKMPQRFMLIKIRKYVKDFLQGTNIEPRMLGISGLRGVGKTTLLWQLAEYVKKNFSNINIYYISLDIASGYNIQPMELVEAFSQILSPSQKYVLLFDEVQYMQNWALMLKILYDKFPQVFILASGSSSVHLHSGIDLASRWNLETLYPLSFTEFVMIRTSLKAQKPLFPEKGLAQRLRNTLFYSRNISQLKKNLTHIEPAIQKYFDKIQEEIEKKVFFKNILHQYILYHNIPRLLLIEEKNTIIDRLLEMLERVISQDIPNTRQALSEVRRFLYFLPITDEYNIEKASQNLGIKKDIIREIINSLIEAEILLQFPSLKGSKNRATQTGKIFFTSPTIRYAIVRKIYANNRDKYIPKLYEDITALYLKRMFPTLTFYGKETSAQSPDFILLTQETPIAIEVGTQKKNTTQINEKKFRYGIIINAKNKKVSYRKNVLYLPLSWFLLT